MNLSGHLIWEHLDILPFFFFVQAFFLKYLHSARKAVLSTRRLWAEKVPCWQTLMEQLSGSNWMSLMCPDTITSVFWYSKKNKHIQTYSHSELNKARLWLKYKFKKKMLELFRACVTSACQTPHSTLQPVRAITTSRDTVPKWHIICSPSSPFKGTEVMTRVGQTSKALIPGSAQVKSALKKKKTSGVNVYFLLALKRCQKSMGELETA